MEKEDDDTKNIVLGKSPFISLDQYEEKFKMLIALETPDCWQLALMLQIAIYIPKVATDIKSLMMSRLNLLVDKYMEMDKHYRIRKTNANMIYTETDEAKLTFIHIRVLFYLLFWFTSSKEEAEMILQDKPPKGNDISFEILYDDMAQWEHWGSKQLIFRYVTATIISDLLH